MLRSGREPACTGAQSHERAKFLETAGIFMLLKRDWRAKDEARNIGSIL